MGETHCVILGTVGYIELRKYNDVAREDGGDQLFIVNQDGDKHFSLAGKVGFPFFGRLILDFLNGTETAMTQKHAFQAAELSLQAQAAAKVLEQWGCLVTALRSRPRPRIGWRRTHAY